MNSELETESNRCGDEGTIRNVFPLAVLSLRPGLDPVLVTI
jgi:hypothetical protein